jgi:hypothetical protein
VINLGYGDGRLVEIEGGNKESYSTKGLVASGVIKPRKGALFGIMGINNSESDQYIHIFDSATVPANGVEPDIVIPVPLESDFSIDFGVHGYKFKKGIAWSNSSTLETKTIGSADCWLNAIYV